MFLRRYTNAKPGLVTRGFFIGRGVKRMAREMRTYIVAAHRYNTEEIPRLFLAKDGLLVWRPYAHEMPLYRALWVWMREIAYWRKGFSIYRVGGIDDRFATDYYNGDIPGYERKERRSA